MTTLTEEQTRHYEEQGYVLVSGLVPEPVAREAATAMWRLIGADPADSGTWAASRARTRASTPPNCWPATRPTCSPPSQARWRPARDGHGAKPRLHDQRLSSARHRLGVAAPAHRPCDPRGRLSCVPPGLPRRRHVLPQRRPAARRGHHRLARLPPEAGGPGPQRPGALHDDVGAQLGPEPRGPGRAGGAHAPLRRRAALPLPLRPRRQPQHQFPAPPGPQHEVVIMTAQQILTASRISSARTGRRSPATASAPGAGHARHRHRYVLHAFAGSAEAGRGRR